MIYFFCRKSLLSEPFCKIDYSVIPSIEKGDEIVIDANGEELKLTWIVMIACHINWQLCYSSRRSIWKNVILFCSSSKRKSLTKLTYELIQKGEQDSFISQQVEIPKKRIQDLKEQRYPAHTKLYQ